MVSVLQKPKKLKTKCCGITKTKNKNVISIYQL